MNVFIENEVKALFDFDHEEVIREVVRQAVESEGCPYDYQVSVVLTDDEGIRDVNLSARGMDRPTDVLSFPMAFYERPADFGRLEEQDDVFDPDTGEYILGDIMISADRVRKQAKDYGHSEKRELAFLTAHSMLHLMGYDHETKEERLLMEDKQEQILQELGITRET